MFSHTDLGDWYGVDYATYVDLRLYNYLFPVLKIARAKNNFQSSPAFFVPTGDGTSGASVIIS